MKRLFLALALLAVTAAASAASLFMLRLPILGLRSNNTPAVTGIVNTGGAGAFADGTYAADCKGYLGATGGYAYTGYTGDGYYWIKPVSGSSAVQAWCDMTADGGGWTRIGTFNGTTDTTLVATQRNAIRYTQAKVSLNGTSTTKLVSCYATPTAGFAQLNTSGLNCTVANPSDSTFYSIRVLQANGIYAGGDYGIYSGSLATTGGCNWGSNVKVWGRHYNGDGLHCTNYGNGETYSSVTTWGANLAWLLVR
jgi:hypothetical protein